MVRLAAGLVLTGFSMQVLAADGSTASSGAAATAPLSSDSEAERARVTTVIQDWVAAVNRDDSAAVTGPWTVDSTIVDSFPPYVWQGPNGAGRWWADYLSLKTSQGLAEVAFKFEPRHIDVIGERAYVVGDAVVDYALSSGRLRDRATWTFCLERHDGAWRFSAWAWGHLDRGASPPSP